MQAIGKFLCKEDNKCRGEEWSYFEVDVQLLNLERKFISDPKYRRQSQVILEVETPPEVDSGDGTLVDKVILCYLGEIMNIFKDWIASQGQGPRQNQEMELE